MSELENIEKLVQEYKPRIEKIFKIDLGEIRVYNYSKLYQDIVEKAKEDGMESPNLAALLVLKSQKKSSLMCTLGGLHNIYINKTALEFLEENYSDYQKILQEKISEVIVHEISHIINSDMQKQEITDKNVKKAFHEGFAEYVSLEFPEVYQNEKLVKGIQESRKKDIEDFKKAEPEIKEQNAPYIKGYEFFKTVGDKIGRENILKVFKKPPKTIQEILHPKKYLERMEKWKMIKQAMKRINRDNWSLPQKGVPQKRKGEGK